VILYGHRGAKGEAPENTVPGFHYARELGVTAFEFDLHLSKSNQIVVIHDATVDRTTNATGKVSDYLASELAALDARHIWPQWAVCGVPTLTEVLGALKGADRLEIEIKTDTPERLHILAEILAEDLERECWRDASRVTLSSFDPIALAAVRLHMPELPRAITTMNPDETFFGNAIALGCSQVDIPLPTGSAEIVAKAKKLGFRVTGWMGNTEKDLATLASWGVDHITTDFPTLAQSYFRNHPDVPLALQALRDRRIPEDQWESVLG
jgi:glycerophosphoryl diester phosphodiesterase